MKIKRKKSHIYICNNMEDLEIVASMCARTNAKLSQIKPQMDVQITAIRNKYANELQDAKDEQFKRCSNLVKKRN